MKAIKLTTPGVFFIGLAVAMAQSAAPKFILAPSPVQTESAEIQVKPDTGEAVSLKLRGDTQVQRVPAARRI